MISQQPIQLESIVTRSEQQVSAEIDGEAVMMSVQQGKYYGLDQIGTYIWQLMRRPLPVSDILNTLLQEYDVNKKTCGQDLLSLLNDLHNQELIHVCDNKN